MKYLRVKFSDGSVWDIPVFVIAEHRAMYYAEKEGESPEQEAEILEREIKEAMDDENTLEDWAANNMDWTDVESKAERVVEPSVDHNEEWTNTEKEIVDK